MLNALYALAYVMLATTFGGRYCADEKTKAQRGKVTFQHRN